MGKDIYTNIPRTNCDNCGAVLINGECPYCNAKWFIPGMVLPNGGQILNASITINDERCFYSDNQKYIVIRTEPRYTVSLEMNLTAEQAKQIFDGLTQKGDSLSYLIRS